MIGDRHIPARLPADACAYCFRRKIMMLYSLMISTVTFLLFFVAAALTTVRKALAILPCLPMTFPISFGCYPKMDDRALFVFCFCDYDTVWVVYK